MDVLVFWGIDDAETRNDAQNQVPGLLKIVFLETLEADWISVAYVQDARL